MRAHAGLDLRRSGIRLVLVPSLVAAASAAAQSGGSVAPSVAAWSGWARCEITTAGEGYADRQSHLWLLTGAPPTTQDAMRIHAALWSVTGQGASHETQGAQSRTAEWTTEVRGMSAPVAFTVRASDGRLLVRPWHAQLRARDAVAGSQQLVVNGVAQRPSAIGLEAFEWAFPSLEEGGTATRLAGTSAPAVTGRVGPMQPASARSAASCSWQFERGSAAPTAVAASAATATTAAPAPGAARPAVTSAPASGAAAELARPPRAHALVRAPEWTRAVPATVPVEQRLAELAELATPAAPPLQTDGGTTAGATRGTPEYCAQRVADVDAYYTSLIHSLELSYAALRKQPMSDKERALLEKQEQVELAALRALRDKAIAQATKEC